MRKNIKNDKQLNDEQLDSVLQSMSSVPELDKVIMEKRIMAAIERGAISSKFAKRKYGMSGRKRPSFWQTLGRETIAMTMVACMILAVLIRVPGVWYFDLQKGQTSEDIILLYTEEIVAMNITDTNEEALLNDIISVNMDNESINEFIQGLPVDTEPDDYWEYFMQG